MKKVLAALAAFTLAASAGTAASAADWSKATYADNKPDSVIIVSYDTNGVTIAPTADGEVTKVQLNLGDILEDPADLDRVYEGSWKVTYTGLSPYTNSKVGWLGGGCYACTGNSAGFSLSPDELGKDDSPVWNDTQTTTDSFKWLLPSSVPASLEDAAFVFMDWSSQDLKTKGVQITFSDLVLLDKDGNEIPQKQLDESPAEPEDVPEDTAEETPEEIAEETAVAEETEAEAIEAAPAEETVPAAVETTASTNTGNTSVAALAALMAAAGAAAVISKKH